MAKFRVGRFLGVLAGTVAILAVGVYAPATLLGPLPAASATTVSELPGQTDAAAPVLAADGASAVILAGDTAPFAQGGSTEALPLASIAKLVTALVVLDAKPLAAGESGEAHTIGTPDYQDYIDYSGGGARTVVVFPKEQWTQREMLQALILGSSNNHADTLARWAYGSVDDYLAAASAWLKKQGLDGITVADATGLSPDSRGTAADVTRLAALVQAEPAIAEILANPPSALVNNRGVSNTTAYLAEEGITGISRSYTDEAGVCLLFTASVPAPEPGGEPLAFSAVFLGSPGYDTLESDVRALMESAVAGAGTVPLIAQGERYGEFTAPWGATASAVAITAQSRRAWAAQDASLLVELDELSTAQLGRIVGSVSVSTPGGEHRSRLELDRAITDPGPAWRLLNPVPMITALLAEVQGS
ncbi:D-alanyl-D-alanine carboxypeptidase family protein [Microterricola viridarii]|uniref:D-alanyl-D-alanine carboxypeptidase (Penicillin-binding protein 5/6) n=1 Tax=Microterricola viridarii TaxID=412690 RepID=A0A1H1TEI3_9MICO|nr:D-alanyl-D-alanine carboxypeptidase [Microterricola viridarii]SDS58588.1 D-alanyl-D-alanine carboxypeptidase (penicillin-binding protein 5/6) [Microterricola viridarii]